MSEIISIFFLRKNGEKEEEEELAAGLLRCARRAVAHFQCETKKLYCYFVTVKNPLFFFYRIVLHFQLKDEERGDI